MVGERHLVEGDPLTARTLARVFIAAAILQLLEDLALLSRFVEFLAMDGELGVDVLQVAFRGVPMALQPLQPELLAQQIGPADRSLRRGAGAPAVLGFGDEVMGGLQHRRAAGATPEACGELLAGLVLVVRPQLTDALETEPEGDFRHHAYGRPAGRAGSAGWTGVRPARFSGALDSGVSGAYARCLALSRGGIVLSHAAVISRADRRRGPVAILIVGVLLAIVGLLPVAQAAAATCTPIPALAQDGSGSTAAATTAPTATTGRLTKAPSSAVIVAALPGEPTAKDSWRVGVSPSISGFAVRIFLNNKQIGSGLIRWDRSYRFTVKLVGYPVSGVPVNIAGTVEGCNILKPTEISKVVGNISGALKLGDTITLTEGKVAWNAAGLTLSGAASIACDQGAIVGSADVAYTDADNWSLELTGATAGGGSCVLSEGLTLSGLTATGGITAAAGAIDGKITGATAIAAPILPGGTWNATFQIVMTGTVKKILTTFDADATGALGSVHVSIGPDGVLVLTTSFGGGGSAAAAAPDTTAYVDPASLLPTTAVVARRPVGSCYVPNVKRGVTLTSVRKAFTKARCKVRLKRVYSAKVKKGRVVRATQKVGKRYAPGTKVTVEVSKGKRPKKMKKKAARRK